MRAGVSAAILNGRYVAGDLEMHDGLITACGLPSTGSALAIPGLVDVQINGYAGVDFLSAAPEEYEYALAALSRDGVFAIQPTLITAPEHDLAGALAAAQIVQSRASSPCAVLGVHVEGPFLSAGYRGIHREEYLRLPDPLMLDRLQSCGPLTTITVAPELPGALELISAAVGRGILVQLGHSSATASQAHAGFNRGARTVTHLYNGMRAFAHREPGIVGAALARNDVTIQIIADGVHVAPEAVQMALRATNGHVVLVTDAISAARAPVGSYTAGGHEVVLGEQGPRLVDGTLAGSITPLLQQVRNVIGYGWPIAAAVNMATANPALLHRRPDLGTLRVGERASFVIVNDDFDLVRVLANGLALNQ